MKGDQKRLEDRIAAIVSETVPAVGEKEAKMIASRIEGLARSGGEKEKRRAERLCRERARRWEKTTAAGEDAPGPAREEARARRNEAEYLADLIASDLDLPGPVDD